MAKFQETILIGDKALDRKLKRLGRKSGNKAARSGLAKGSRLAAKLIKAEVPSSQKHIRKAIGSRVKKAKGGPNSGMTEAKAGAAVGRGKSDTKERGKRAGVGISRQNIHWYIMGTDERTQTSTGRSTGAMPPNPIVERAMASGIGGVRAAIREGTKAAIIREAKKK